MPAISTSWLICVTVLVLCACSPADNSGSSNALGNASADGNKEGKPDDAMDGPFGIAMGSPIAEVEDAKALDKPGFYQVASPPKGHPDFESVVLIAYPQTGICLIRGIGKNLESDGAGIEIRSKVDNLAAALDTKYGKSEKADACAGGDVQCSGEFWMMTMSGGERAYAYQWNKPTNATKIGIGEITVAAQAADIQTSYPILEFRSNNKDACLKAERSASASSL